MWRLILAIVLSIVSIGVAPANAYAARCPEGTHAASSGAGQAVVSYLKLCVADKKQGESSSRSDRSNLDREGCEMAALGSVSETSGCEGVAISSEDPVRLARSVVARLNLPRPTPIFGPDPKKNEWKMLAVGFPIWLTTEGARRKSVSTSADGLDLTLTADLQSTTFAMGDGSQVTCTAMTPFTASSKAGSASPTCGHTYTKPSLPKGSYTVTATANWLINWSVDGFSGSFPMSYSDSAQLAIGELQALNR